MIAIINGKVYTEDAILEKGTVMIKDGKIEAVGADVQVPEGAEIIDAQGKMVTPGLIDPHSHIGIGEEGIGLVGLDINEMTDPITPQLRAIDAIYPDDVGFLTARQAGVTTVVTGPGSANAIGGTFLAMKTFGRRVDDMVIKNPVAMKMAFGENVKGVYREQDTMPMTRMGIMAVMRDFFYKAKEYMKKKEDTDPSKQPDYDLRYEAILPVLKGELKVKAHAHRTDDIFSAIRLAKEFDLDMTIEHCTEGHLIADLLAEEGYGAICGPNMSSSTKYELRNRSFVTPAVLHEAGIPFAIMTDNYVIPTAQLPVAAGLAARSGLSETEALKGITLYAAQLTGIDDRVGSLAPGKDADVVIWTANPIRDIDCEPVRTIIDGKTVYELGVDEKFGF
ncbi:MAG: amidohydrolase [Peptoniphilaceae bacterium]|jgi:imidazolonepropionase-like amidohydrolase